MLRASFGTCRAAGEPYWFRVRAIQGVTGSCVQNHDYIVTPLGSMSNQVGALAKGNDQPLTSPSAGGCELGGSISFFAFSLLRVRAFVVRFSGAEWYDRLSSTAAFTSSNAL